MNVSFSTRGWQQIPWEQQVQMAETMRFGGIELYNVHKTPELTGRGGPLHRYTAAATARELWQKGLCIPCFDEPPAVTDRLDVSDGPQPALAV